MGVLNYLDLTTSDIEVYRTLAAAAYRDSAEPTGWSSLGADDLGLSASDFNGDWYEKSGWTLPANARIMVEGDTLTLSFRGTEDLVDMTTYPSLPINPTTPVIGGAAYIWQYDSLLQAVADYVNDGANGISDVQITGHSLGAAAANQLQVLASAGGYYDGVYDDATYVSFATPVWFRDGSDIFNVGFDNDAVFNILNPISGFSDHSTDGLVFYDSIYAENDGAQGFVAHTIGESVVTSTCIADRSGEAYQQMVERLMLSGLADDSAYDNSTPVIVDAYDGAVAMPDSLGDRDGIMLGEPLTDDTISGGASSDVLVGLAGRDELAGGSGADTFRFLWESCVAVDQTATITDLGRADRLEMVDVALWDPVAGDGTDLAVGEVQVDQFGDDTIIYVGIDPDADVDIAIILPDTDYSHEDFAVSGDELYLNSLVV